MKETNLKPGTKRSSAKDMTSGPIAKQLILFALPLMLGNVFQLLYNTVDSLVVGNFVGKEALAAVGSTSTIVNVLVLFFNGVSVGAGVVISQHFGAKDMEKLHTSIETTMCMTFGFGILFTIIGVAGVTPMLRFMSTPEDVIPQATLYLRIYFAGISGLLVYNMGSGILRAVGDTTRPLLFLILSSVLNIILDLLFVLAFHLGIAGVGLATILSQFISAALVLLLLTRTRDIYRLSWKELRIDGPMLRRILGLGLPTGIQAMITSFSNVFVQSYVNVFGSGVMAGWSCYNKLDQFVFLPMQSMSSAATTFVGQNIGANQVKRANRGTAASMLLTVLTTVTIATVLFIFADAAAGIFSSDAEVVHYGALFVRMNVYFLIANCVNHVLAGALRGRGDSKGPMVIMLATFVVVRQIYLFVITRFFMNTPVTVGLGYPVGWVCCCTAEVAYFFIRWGRSTENE